MPHFASQLEAISASASASDVYENAGDASVTKTAVVASSLFIFVFSISVRGIAPGTPPSRGDVRAADLSDGLQSFDRYKNV